MADLPTPTTPPPPGPQAEIRNPAEAWEAVLADGKTLPIPAVPAGASDDVVRLHAIRAALEAGIEPTEIQKLGHVGTPPPATDLEMQSLDPTYAAKGEPEMSAGSRIPPMIGQMIVPAVAGAFGVTNPIGLGALGLAGALGGTLAGDRMQPDVPLGKRLLAEGTQAGLTEAGTPIAQKAYGAVQQGVRSLVGSDALETGLSGASRRLGIPLSGTERFGESPYAAKVASKALGSKAYPEKLMTLGKTGAEAIGEVLPKELGNLLPLPYGGGTPQLVKDPLQGANTMVTRLQALHARTGESLTPDAFDTLNRQIKTRYGITVQNLTGPGLLTRMEKKNGAAAALGAITDIATAAGANPETYLQIARNAWGSNLLSKNILSGPNIPQITQGGLPNSDVIARTFRRLTPQDKVALWGNNLPAAEELFGVLEAAKTARSYTKSLSGTPMEGMPDPVKNWWPLTKAMRTVLGGQAGPRNASWLLFNEKGIRWLAAGVQAAQQGVSNDVLIPALSRGLAQIVADPVAESMVGGPVTVPQAGPATEAPTGGPVEVP